MMTYIDVTKISGHPDNPRKDLGDLTELAASIKENGILQNLTVVPWFSEITYAPADNNKMDGYYVVVIGHRRLSAAKLAGLKEVPCVIADMDLKTQVSTMLLENIQRSDLTVWEQAQGFQMMLNLGETIADISQKTGFSETTVRRRTKLIDLDNDGFKLAVERGATLLDFAELDKISDHELKNSVLNQVGTPNFNYALRSAIDKEKSAIAKAEIIAQLDTFATPVESTEGLRNVRYIYWSGNSDLQKPDDAVDKKYFYYVSQYNIQLLIEQSQEQVSNTGHVDAEKQKLNALRSQLDEISKRAYRLRLEFIKNYSASKAKKHSKAIMEFSVRGMMDGGDNDLDEDMLLDILGIELDDEDEFSFDVISDRFSSSPELILLVTTYCYDSDSSHWKYYGWQCTYENNANLNGIYKFLTTLGYEMSDEERALYNGTHELYVNIS